MRGHLFSSAPVRRDAELQSWLQRWRLTERRPNQTSVHLEAQHPQKAPWSGRKCLALESKGAGHRKKYIYFYFFFFLLEDVLFTLGNQIERQRRGSGLQWIFLTPLPFCGLGREGETQRRSPPPASSGREKKKWDEGRACCISVSKLNCTLAFSYVFVQLVMQLQLIDWTRAVHRDPSSADNAGDNNPDNNNNKKKSPSSSWIVLGGVI